MSKRKTAKTSLFITDRALTDLVEIERYSIETWGKRIANRYIRDIEDGLQRIRENPHILKAEHEFHHSLHFYRVNQHLLVCDRQGTDIFVLTVLNASMDIPSRLDELSPTLKLEVELLHRKLKGTRKK